MSTYSDVRINKQSATLVAAAQAQGGSAGGAGGPSGDGSQAADGAAEEEVADAEIVDEGKGA